MLFFLGPVRCNLRSMVTAELPTDDTLIPMTSYVSLEESVADTLMCYFDHI